MPLMSNRNPQMASAPQATGDQAKSLFEEGLSQMAYGVLLNKLPNISPDVATFKVLQSDPEEGHGVGAFVVVRQGQTLYIPVVMAESQIKPLDILFYKDLNIFLPLTKEWMEEIDKLSLGEMGHGSKAPQSLSSDVDIRQTVVPPNTGRYSYASEDADIERMLIAMRNHETAPTKLAFLDFLQKAPDVVKEATQKFFGKYAHLNAAFVGTYGKKAVEAALTRSKTASTPASKKPELVIATDKTSAEDFKNLFGTSAGEAFQGVKIKGYYAKDDRKSKKVAIRTEANVAYKEPMDAGAYRVWTRDGKDVLALITGKPVDVFNPEGGDKRIPARNTRFVAHNNAPASGYGRPSQAYRPAGSTGNKDEFYTDRFVGVTADGKLIDVDALMAEPVDMGELEGTSAYKKMTKDSDGARAGATGVFIARRSVGFVMTVPVTIKTVTTSNGVKKISVEDQTNYGPPTTLVLDPNGPRGKIIVSGAAGLSYLPADAVFMPTSEKLTKDDLLTRQKDVETWLNRGLLDAGGEKVALEYSDRAHSYFVGRTPVYSFTDALYKLANEARLDVEDAAELLKQSHDGRVEFWLVDPATVSQKMAEVRAKLANVQAKLSGKAENGSSSEKSVAPGKKTDPTTPGAKTAADDSKKKGSDPAQGAMDDVAMQQQMAAQAAQPSPVDMAVAEQMQMLQMQSQALQNQMQMLQMVQQRAQMIAGGGAAASPMGAAAMAGGPMPQQMLGAGAPMDPSMMQQQQGGGMPQQGMDPSMMQQPQQGMDPSMQQGQPPMQPGAAPGGMAPPAQPGQMGMDPSMAQGQQSPQDQGQAFMAGEDDSPDALAAQVNPQYMDAAGQLNDSGIFDAAALSSMAQSPALKDMVGAYLPNLEKSLDNVGRVLLTLWMDESKIKADIGNETFVALEDNLRTVFKNLGDLILKMNQNTLVMRGPNDPAYKE
jgi:hypothetical protein